MAETLSKKLSKQRISVVFPLTSHRFFIFMMRLKLVLSEGIFRGFRALGGQLDPFRNRM